MALYRSTFSYLRISIFLSGVNSFIPLYYRYFNGRREARDKNTQKLAINQIIQISIPLQSRNVRGGGNFAGSEQRTAHKDAFYLAQLPYTI